LAFGNLVFGSGMNGTRIAIAVVAIGALAAGLTYLRKEAVTDSHRQARQLVLYYTLSRLEQPIVVVGDSITEASALPRTLCGHPLVNAGLNGASTSSDLATWLTAAFDGRRAAAILVALGTNDALLERSRETFATDYAALLAGLAKVTDRLAVLGIPAIEVRGNVTAELQTKTMAQIDAFNAMLPALAARSGVTFAALPPMPTPHTIDGVHLDAAGYAVWDAAALKGVQAACSTQ
jgi:lysophospholipase L1-like esterase